MLHHVSIGVESLDRADAEAVDAFHAAALRAGAADEGAPGILEHYDPGYYAAFARDPDGHRIEAVVFGGPAD